MLKKYRLLIVFVTFLIIGVYSWFFFQKMNYGSRFFTDEENEGKFPTRSTIVYVGDTPITSEDLEWEFELHTKGLLEEDLSPSGKKVEAKGKNDQLNLSSLRERLVASLIERKLLYKFIKQDTTFDLSNSSRYTDCIKEWQDAVADSTQGGMKLKDTERLKSKLCEKSILFQYLNERVFSKIDIDEEAMLEYYDDNPNLFKREKKVLIRQVVSASEREARKIRARIRRTNFAHYAESKSISPEAKNKGLLGPFAKGEMPRIFDVAFSMRRGEIRGILKSTYGFHIIMLEKKFPAVKLTFEESKDRIRKILREKRKEQEYQKWLEMALSSIPVRTPKPLW